MGKLARQHPECCSCIITVDTTRTQCGQAANHGHKPLESRHLISHSKYAIINYTNGAELIEYPVPTLVDRPGCTNIDFNFNKTARPHKIPGYFLPSYDTVKPLDRVERHRNTHCVLVAPPGSLM